MATGSTPNPKPNDAGPNNVSGKDDRPPTYAAVVAGSATAPQSQPQPQLQTGSGSESYANLPLQQQRVFGPTPLISAQPLLLPYAYYGPLDVARSRARRRFLGAFCMGVLIYMAVGALVGVEVWAEEAGRRMWATS